MIIRVGSHKNKRAFGMFSKGCRPFPKNLKNGFWWTSMMGTSHGAIKNHSQIEAQTATAPIWPHFSLGRLFGSCL